MRLIDADKLLEYLDKPNVLTNRLSPEDKETVRNIVKSQPTAYNIDKIVEKLKNQSFIDNQLNKVVDLEEAIEIVKVGGKNE